MKIKTKTNSYVIVSLAHVRDAKKYCVTDFRQTLVLRHGTPFATGTSVEQSRVELSPHVQDQFWPKKLMIRVNCVKNTIGN